MMNNEESTNIQEDYLKVETGSKNELQLTEGYEDLVSQYNPSDNP